MGLKRVAINTVAIFGLTVDGTSALTLSANSSTQGITSSTTTELPRDDPACVATWQKSWHSGMAYKSPISEVPLTTLGGTSGFFTTGYVDVATVFETIESLGPSRLYSCSDGITRLKRLGTPTTTISRFVTATHRRVRQVDWVEQSRSSSTHPSTTQSKATQSSTLRSSPPQSKSPEPKFDFGSPPCNLYGAHRFCRQNATDLIWDGPNATNFTAHLPGDCFDYTNNCVGELTVDEVVLIYWPPNGLHAKDISEDLCGLNRTSPQTDGQRPHGSPRIATLDEITFSGQDLYLRSRSTVGGTRHWFTPPSGYVGTSIMKGPFTFTSPTIYVAHHPITFSHTAFVTFPAGSAVFDTIILFPKMNPKTIPPGILEVQSTDVFSIRENKRTNLNDFEYASLVANGKYKPEELDDYDPRVSTVPFNFANLQDPVPASVYFDAHALDCWHEQSHCQTITDGSYRPRLVLGSKVWKQYSEVREKGCYMPNLVDPPLALEPVDGESRAAEGSNRPLPKILREPKAIDQNMAAFATATDADRPRGTGFPLEPGPIPSKVWPAPTATSGSTSGRTRGENNGAKLEILDPKDTNPDAKGDDGYGLPNNGGVVLTSGSSGAHTLFPSPMAGTWAHLALPLSWVAIIAVL